MRLRKGHRDMLLVASEGDNTVQIQSKKTRDYLESHGLVTVNGVTCYITDKGISEISARLRSKIERGRAPVNLPVKSNLDVVKDFFHAAFAHGRTCKSIGEDAGISPVILSNWRNGKNSPLLSQFSFACEALGYRLALVPIDE